MEVTNYYDSTEWIETVERQYTLDAGWVSLTTGGTGEAGEKTIRAKTAGGMVGLMSEKNTGGPAYPGQPLGTDGTPSNMFWEGMTLRDYFAGQALVGILSGNVWKEYTIRDYPEAEAYRMADAMLEERDR